MISTRPHLRRAALLLALLACAALPVLAAGVLLAPERPDPPPADASAGDAARHAATETAAPRDAQADHGGPDRERPGARRPPVRYRDSRALGLPYGDGRLVRGVKLPREGRDFYSWDPILERSPNRSWRRFGTDGLVRTILEVLRDHRRAYPGAPRVAVGDLSRPRGGDFGPQFGGIGHSSHQNGLDADVYYPRLDERERSPESIDQVDLPLAQDLVDRFAAAGAERVFVGPSTGLTGPAGVVEVLENHDDHLHVRLPPGRD